MPPVPNQTAKASARIPEIDGLRGIAIGLVLIWHYFAVPATPASGGGAATGAVVPGAVMPFWASLLQITWSGVDLFFVLSGFLIGGILLDHKRASNYFQVFYIRRFFRIVPVYYLWLLLFFLLQPLTGGLLAKAAWMFETTLPAWSFPSFTQNFVMAVQNTFGPRWLGLTWSLAVEEQFYLVLPLLIYLTPTRKLPYLLGGLIIAAPLLRTWMVVTGALKWLGPYVLMPARADALLLGVLCAWLFCYTDLRLRLARWQRPLYLALAVLMAGAAVLVFRSPEVVSAGMQKGGFTWLAVLYTVMLLIALSEVRGPVTLLVRSPLLQRLGVIAYGVYLFHQGVNGLLHTFLGQGKPSVSSLEGVLITLAALALTLTVAQLSWNYFEKPLVTRGHAHRYNGLPAAPAPEGADGIVARRDPNGVRSGQPAGRRLRPGRGHRAGDP